MSVTKEDFAKLVKLQEHDKLLDGLRAEVAKIPEEIEALRAEVSGDKEKLAAAKKNTQELQVQKKSKETDMGQKEENIKKHQGALNAVKTNEAFKALLKEIEDAKTAVGDLETEILELLDRIDGAEQSEKEAKALLEKAESENNKKVQVLEVRKSETEKKLQEQESARGVLTEGVSEELVTLYDKTRERREGIALAEVRDSMCMVCHVKQPPQVLLDLRKGKKILTCENCQRIMHEPIAAQAAESGA